MYLYIYLRSRQFWGYYLMVVIKLSNTEDGDVRNSWKFEYLYTIILDIF